MTIPLLGDIPPSRVTYVADGSTLLRESIEYLGPASLLAGAIKITHFDSQADYAVIDPSVAPFVSRTLVHFKGSFFGSDTGEVERETVYTDYRRVKCYDDRFETRVGAPQMIDFVPEK